MTVDVSALKGAPGKPITLTSITVDGSEADAPAPAGTVSASGIFPLTVQSRTYYVAKIAGGGV
jgi:hypothetical protein